ncbi:MAG TPA: CHAT domain-containing protein, partial [Kofleriaceae bacterium]
MAFPSEIDMFDKLHLLSQDAPESGGGLRWRAHPYLRMIGAVPKGPAVFDWNERQRKDLEALWRDPSAEGARERLAAELAAFCDKLGWAPDPEMLASAEKHGDEYLVTLSAIPSELYLLPWEVIQAGAAGTYLSDYASAQVRYAVPGLEPREVQGAPPEPGVLFAWSGAGGAVPHEDQAAAIRAAAEAGGVTFRELAQVDEGSLQAALDAGPPSVLHLLCHGLPGPEGEPPRLVWGASDGRSEITATRLARMLRHHNGTIRLVVLSACGSGDGRGDPLFMGSVAQELHKKGIPNVVASRYPLSVPGSRVLTRALYDKLLREAWSLERSLRHTREALLRVGDDGESHSGDAYGIQLYAYDTERFVSDNDVLAERPVLASYPFGTAARPVPASGPPAAELTLNLEADPGPGEAQLADKLRRVSEDESLTVATPSHTGKGPRSLLVRTTVDGAQRLLGAWRSKALQVAVGVIVGELIMTKGIPSAMASTASAATGKAANSNAGAAPGHAAASAGKVLATKLVVASVIGSVAEAAGSVAVYRSRGQSAAPTAAVAKNSPAPAAPAPSPPESQVAEPATPAPPPSDATTTDAAGPDEAGPPPAGNAPSRRSVRPSRPAAPPDAALPDAAPPDAAPPDAAPGPSSADVRPTAVCGNGTVEAGEQCDDGNTVDGDGCSSLCRAEPRMVPSTDLNRISGQTHVDPREETRIRMIRDGVSSVSAVVKLCIATTGSVTQAKMAVSTGYDAY